MRDGQETVMEIFLLTGCAVMAAQIYAFGVRPILATFGLV